jgi:hypothetical protein
VILKPTGTNGNIIKLTKVSPKVLTLNKYNTVTITGKNFHPGVMAHMSAAGVKVDMIEYVSKSKILACLKPSADLQGGQDISLRMINVNGESVDLDGAFTIDQAEEPTPVSFSREIQPIFGDSCALPTCHMGPINAGGMNLSK